MKTEDKELNKAAEKCVKDIMKIEHKKQRRTELMIDGYVRKHVAASVRRRDRK